MSVAAFAERLTSVLETAGIKYMIAGSLASSFYGEPRTTQDVDAVIDGDEAAIQQLLASLPPSEFYVDNDAAMDALRNRRQFNLIEMATGWKADLIFRKERDFSRAEFGRRQQVQAFGIKMWMVTPEDLVISKLEWAKQANSERQLRDVAGILAAKTQSLDIRYIESWVDLMGLRPQWSRVVDGDG